MTRAQAETPTNILPSPSAVEYVFGPVQPLGLNELTFNPCNTHRPGQLNKDDRSVVMRLLCSLTKAMEMSHLEGPIILVLCILYVTLDQTPHITGSGASCSATRQPSMLPF